MSRILRRPMFRGGRVSSYGTGIASGLADGGRVGFYNGGFGAPDFKLGAQVLEDASKKLELPRASVGFPFFLPNSNEMALSLAGAQNEVETTGDEKTTGDKKITGKGEMWEYWDALGEGGEMPLIIPKTEAELFEDNFNRITKLIEKGKFLSEKDRAFAKEHGLKMYDELFNVQGESIGDQIVLDESKETTAISDTELTQEQKKILELEKIIAAREEKPEVDAKTAVAENKELFRDLLGYKEARGEDISDMLMSASAKFLKPGATVRGGLGEFMEAESVRPSRMQKIKDAAGTLAIQDYISGKKSKEAVKLMRATEDYRPTAKLKAMMPTLDDSPQMALIKFAQINGTDNVGSERTIKDAIKFKTKQPVVTNTKIKLEDVEKPSKQKHLKIGYNIIEKDTIKYYVKWDGINYDILTFEQIWAQE